MLNAINFFKTKEQSSSTSEEAESDEEASSITLIKQHSPYTMTEEELAKKLEKKYKGRHIPQLIVTCIVSFGALFFGLYLKWSDQFFKNTSDEFTRKNLTREEYGYLISLIPCGCVIGIVPWSYVVDAIGPKHTLIIQGPLYFISYLVISFNRISYTRFTRVLSGFFSIPVLIGGECLLLDTMQRGYFGRMMVLFRSALPLGVFLSIFIQRFIYEFVLTIVISVVIVTFTVLLFFIPESPVHLYNENKIEAAKSLKWFKGKESIYTELKLIKQEADIRKVGIEPYMYMFTKRAVYRAYFIILGLLFFQVFSGYFILIFYQFILWSEYTETITILTVLLYGFCLYISSVVGTAIHYRLILGVRKPLLLSTILISLHLTILTIYAYMHQQKMIVSKEWEWLPLLAINTFVISYEVGLGTYPEILLHLYLPYKIYPLAKTTFLTSYWLQIFLLTRYFLLVCSLVPKFIIFTILTGISYASILFCYTYIVETKNKTFMQIQILIGGTPIGTRRGYTNHFCKPPEMVF